MRGRLHFLGVMLVTLAGPVSQWAQEAPAVPENVKTIIGRNCSVARCHQGKHPAGDLNLEPAKFLAATLNAASQKDPGKMIIDTSAPEKSYILAKVKGEPGIVGSRMPPRRNPLTADEIRAIETWILSVKKRNPDH